MTLRSVAIVQPYIFPYLGYFQLVRATDHFVAYDDVQFIKGGWINRNRISSKGVDTLFTVPVQGGSQQRIHDVISVPDDKWIRKFSAQLQHEYGKARSYAKVRDLVLSTFEGAQGMPVSILAVRSIAAVMNYLDLPFDCVLSSEAHPRTVGLKRAERLIAISRAMECGQYVNLPGGLALYNTAQFAAEGIDLRFIFNRSNPYPQFSNIHLPHLSIIDVLMHTSPDTARDLIGQYDLLTAEQVTNCSMSAAGLSTPVTKG